MPESPAACLRPTCSRRATASEASAIGWAQIARLNGMPAKLVPSPVIELNRAVAAAMPDGPAACLDLVAVLEASGALCGYHLPAATRAGLLRRLGRLAEAGASYREALDLASTDAGRRFLAGRLAEAEAF